MAEKKKYYWLRLKRDFFKRHDIQIVEAMPNGKDYILFYLKLLCESVDHEGNLRFSDEIPYNEQMLSTLTNTNIDIVRSAIEVFSRLGMMDILDDGTYYMVGIERLIGTETDEHVREQNRIRQQRHRAKLKLAMKGDTSECVYCGGEGDTIDHIIPKATGGTDNPDNIVCSCLRCNMKKNNLPLDNFLNNMILDHKCVDIDGIRSNPKLNRYVEFDYQRNRFIALEALRNAMSRVTCHGEIEKEKEIEKDNKYTCAFSEFWKHYPRKKEKSKAYKCYKARLKDGYSEEELLAACINYAAECEHNKTEERYIKLGATFLSINEPFADYLKGENFGQGNTSDPREREERERGIEEVIRRIESGEADHDDDGLWDDLP